MSSNLKQKKNSLGFTIAYNSDSRDKSSKNKRERLSLFAMYYDNLWW